MHDFHSLFFEGQKSPSCHLRRRDFLISDFFYTMKMVEQTFESELEDSSGEYETAAEINGSDQRTDAVRDVICDVIMK